jgi:ppGpp synthetase/RelA/SpoT-type nucleotidyltranferase
MLQRARVRKKQIRYQDGNGLQEIFNIIFIAMEIKILSNFERDINRLTKEIESYGDEKSMDHNRQITNSAGNLALHLVELEALCKEIEVMIISEIESLNLLGKMFLEPNLKKSPAKPKS